MKSLRWFLFTLVLLFNVNAQAQPTCYPNDSLAVQMLFDSLGIAYTTSMPVSLWVGITTIPDVDFPTTFYRIQEINISAQGAFGILPDSLFEGDSLQYLQVLDLQNNNIVGVSGFLRYDAVSTPPALHTIFISDNFFNTYNSQFFLYFFQNMSNLQYFYANRCTSGSSPLRSYNFSSNSLQELYLQQTGMTDTLFMDTLLLGYLPSLKTLHLGKNNLTGIQASGAYSIERLYINDNNIQSTNDIVTVLENANLLIELGAAGARGLNAFEDLVFNPPFHLENLNFLDLSFNRLTGELPLALFEKLDSIKILALQGNFFSGEFPIPSTVAATGPFAGERYYEGTGRLHNLYLYSNDLVGELPLNWLLAQQFISYPGNNGADMPLQEIHWSDNQFTGVGLDFANSIVYQAIANPSYSSRFSNLTLVSTALNNLDFIDLYHLKKFFRFQQGNAVAGAPYHYYPQAAFDSTAFEYGSQVNLGIGGVKRRATNTEVTFDEENTLVADFPGNPYYISNKYSWERIDTVGLAGGTPVVPVTQYIGQIYQNGGSASPNLVIAHGLSATDTTYHLGVDLTPQNAHKLFITPLDSVNHALWTYQAKITNDSFPLLTLYTKPKKLEVGPCVDASGQPVHCQSMMVQFDPIILATLTPVQQDSMKEALRESLGAKVLESCLCGDIELWEISDTASAMLEGNGSGTKAAASQTSTKPQLLSADPNYDLLAADTTNIPTGTMPVGSGNNTAKTLVAIIDSGMDFGYTPLRSHISEGLPMDTSCINNAYYGYNFLNINNNALDDHGHGTAVASVVAGISKNNLLPDTGVYAGKIAILPLKYTNKKGKGSLFHAACAMRYAADFQKQLPNGDTARVRVINASWGFLGDPSSLIDNTLKYVGENCDILVVCSAGNDGRITHGADSLRHWPSNSIFDPADTIAIDNVLGVGAIPRHQADSLTSYSNFSNKHIDLAAQGNDSLANAGSANGFVWKQGTSFAAPQVARAAALLFDKYPDATYFAIKYALMNGVDKLQSADSLKLKSKGRLNYIKADSILNGLINRTLCAENGFTIDVQKIDDGSMNDLVNLYPNPVSNELNLDFDAKLLDKEISLNLFNVQGQSLFQQNLNQGTTHLTISTKDLPAGVYFIQLNTDTQQINKRFLKR